MSFSNGHASLNILTAVNERRLVQGKWQGKGADGRWIACLLGAIDPKVNDPSDCNADLMPLWLAKLTPTLFDGILVDHIYHIARRYGELIGRWRVVTPQQWDEIHTAFLVYAIDTALDAARRIAVKNSVYWRAARDACLQCRQAVSDGDLSPAASRVSQDAWMAASRAARVAEIARMTKRDPAASEAAAAAAATAAHAAVDGNARLAAMMAAEAVRVVCAHAPRNPTEIPGTEMEAFLKMFIFLMDKIEEKCVAGRSPQ
jgi:hypothetical protein